MPRVRVADSALNCLGSTRTGPRGRGFRREQVRPPGLFFVTRPDLPLGFESPS